MFSKLFKNDKYVIISHIPFSIFISKGHIKTLIGTIITVYTIVGLTALILLHFMLDTIADLKQDRVDRLFNNQPPMEICKHVHCMYMKNMDTGVITFPDYIKKLPQHNPLFDIRKPLTTRVIVHNRNLYYVNNDIYLRETINKLNTLLYLLLLPIVIYYCIKVYNIEKKKVLDKRNYKYSIEGQIQRNLTESLYHELNGPLSIIKTLISDLYSSLFFCPNSKSICSRLTNNKDGIKCKDTECSYKDNRFRDIADHYQTIEFALERIKSTITLVAKSKDIKYNNENISFYTIVDNVIASCNILSVNKLHSSYENLDILNNYAIAGRLNNGDIMNVLTVLVNNSLEAKATNITISADINNLSNYIGLYVKDNGTGIQDELGNVRANNEIFNYGYSSKEKNNLSWFRRFLYRFGIVMKSNTKVKGAGLALNKQLLLSNGGDITIYKTSRSGTTFKLLLPCKKIK